MTSALRRRVSAIDPSLLKRKKRERKREGRKWLLKQRCSKRAKWTRFMFPMEKVERCYNLRKDVFEQMKLEYLTGTREGRAGCVAKPKKTDQMPQELIAAHLILGCGLSVSEFVSAKNLATERNTGRSSAMNPSEHDKWPARPNIFLRCPTVDPEAVSDDEVAEWYLNGKFDSESEDEATVESDKESDQSEAEDETLSGGGEDDAFIIGIEKGTVQVLRHLCQTSGSWGGVTTTEKRYGVGRSTAFSLRSAVTKLRNGSIPNVSWEEFAETFQNDELMSMKLRSDKVETIRHVVDLSKTW